MPYEASEVTRREVAVERAIIAYEETRAAMIRASAADLGLSLKDHDRAANALVRALMAYGTAYFMIGLSFDYDPDTFEVVRRPAPKNGNGHPIWTATEAR